jgi:hypothetical protein
MTPKDKLIEQGYTWEEAEEQLWAQAEEQADAERDRELEEKLNQGESK